MNVTLTLGGLNTAASYAAATPDVSTNSTAAAMNNAYGSTAQSTTSAADSLSSQDSSSSNFTRYTSQYRRLATIVLNSAGRYDHDQQMRAYMELRTMAASGKLQGMQADDQRLWMEVNNNSVSLLQDSDSSDSSDTSSVSSSSATDSSSSASNETSSSLLQTSDTSDTSSVNDSDSGDTVDLSPTAQEIIQELQEQASDKLSPLEVLLSQQDDENSSSEVGTVISLTV